MSTFDLPQSPREAFESRRSRLLEKWQTVGGGAPIVFPAGWARPRNFAHNVFPLRAESHFLYFVGRHIEGALLVLSERKFTLCLPEVDEEMSLWDGPSKSCAEWEAELGVEVRDVDFALSLSGAAVLPPQDEETAGWLSALLERAVTAQGGPELSGVDATLGDVMVDLRLSHDAAAIRQLRAAASATARAHQVGMTAVRRASREVEVRGAMEGSLIAQGLSPGYTSIVTTHGEILHASRSDGLLSDGELLLCDVGGETREGFTGDITRTFPVRGEWSKTQRAIYDLVLSVQRSAIEGAVVGKSYVDLHLGAVRQTAAHLKDLGILRGEVEGLLESGAASVFFPHGLGHLLGLDVHDMEDLGDRAGYGSEGVRGSHPSLAALRLCRTLRAGMCVTIEPGFYQVPMLLERARRDEVLSSQIDWHVLEEFADVRGIRIEDDVLVTEKGPDVLTRDAPKDADEISRLVRG